MLVAEQIRVFLMIMGLGAALAFLSDCYQVVRRLVKPRRLIGNTGDILFWIVAAGAAFLTLLHINLAEIRFYIFLGMTAGWMLYALLLSEFVKAALWRVLRIVVYFVGYLIRVFLIPLALIIKTVCFPGGAVLKVLKSIRGTLKRKSRSLLKRFKWILPSKKPPTKV